MIEFSDEKFLLDEIKKGNKVSVFNTLKVGSF